jgi:hypothetical protein
VGFYFGQEQLKRKPTENEVKPEKPEDTEGSTPQEKGKIE